MNIRKVHSIPFLLSSAFPFHFDCVHLFSHPLCAAGPAGPQGSEETFFFAAWSGASCVGGWRRHHWTGRERWSGGATTRGRVYICSQKSCSLWQQAPSLGPWNLCHLIFVMTSCTLPFLCKMMREFTGLILHLYVPALIFSDHTALYHFGRQQPGR